MTELYDLSALELAERIRAKKISSLEATKFFLDRIDRLNPELVAFVSVHKQRALRSAAAKDEESRSSKEQPIFHGVPSALKDLVPALGSFTQLGSKAYQGFIAPFDSTTARRFRKGGFVMLGKLATSEFGALPVTEPDIHPPTRNPWDQRRTPGGSSGGSAAAVAGGLLPIAQGSDGGGSIRIPGAFCHLFGFKPSLGLHGNLLGKVNLLGMSVMGSLALTVEDSAAMFDVLRGHPYASDRDPDSCLAASRKPVKKLRIGISTASPLGGLVDPEIAAATEDMARLLASLGHDVEHFTIAPGSVKEFLPLWQFQMAAVPSPGDGRLQPVTKWLREGGRKVQIGEAQAIQASLEARMQTMFGPRDILLTPTVPAFPPLIGSGRGSTPEAIFYALAENGSFTATFNATDRPAASVPAALSKERLPIGVQLGAQRGQDHLLFALCKQIEAARPWRQARAFRR